MKLGLAKAFGKFSEYQLAKYDREGTVRPRAAVTCWLKHGPPTD